MVKGRLSILLAFRLVVANIQCSEFCALGACYDGERRQRLIQRVFHPAISITVLRFITSLRPALTK